LIFFSFFFLVRLERKGGRREGEGREVGGGRKAGRGGGRREEGRKGGGRKRRNERQGNEGGRSKGRRKKEGGRRKKERKEVKVSTILLDPLLVLLPIPLQILLQAKGREERRKEEEGGRSKGRKEGGRRKEEEGRRREKRQKAIPILSTILLNPLLVLLHIPLQILLQLPSILLLVPPMVLPDFIFFRLRVPPSIIPVVLLELGLIFDFVRFDFFRVVEVVLFFVGSEPLLVFEPVLFVVLSFFFCEGEREGVLCSGSGHSGDCEVGRTREHTCCSLGHWL
jgi:hypothetical protein